MLNAYVGNKSSARKVAIYVEATFLHTMLFKDFVDNWSNEEEHWKCMVLGFSSFKRLTQPRSLLVEQMPWFCPTVLTDRDTADISHSRLPRGKICYCGTGLQVSQSHRSQTKLDKQLEVGWSRRTLLELTSQNLVKINRGRPFTSGTPYGVMS